MKSAFPHFNYKLMGALVAAEVLSTFETAMIFAALRKMIEDFGDPGAVGWIITSFMLSAVVSAALCSRLGDMYDRRRMLLFVIGIGVVGSLIAGSSSTLAGVIVGRVIQGGAGAIFPLCVGILRENVEAKALPLYLGILTAILTVSGGLGLLLGGIIIDHLTWHAIFFVNALVGVVAWIAIYFAVPPSKLRNAEPGTNFVGGLLFVPGLVLLLLVLTNVKSWGWGNPYTIGLLAGGLSLLALWIRSELRAKVPLLDIRLMANRELLLVNLSALLLGLTWNQFQQFWSILLQQPVETGAGLGLSASMAGLVLQPQTLMALVGGPVAGWFVVRYSTRAGMAVGALILAGAWVATLINHGTVPMILVLMIFMGFSSAFLYAMFPMIIAREAPAARTSEVTGMMSVVRATATSVGAQVVAFLLSTSTVLGPDGQGSFPDSAAYNLTIGYIAAGSLAVFFLYVFLSRPGHGAARTAAAASQ